MLPANKSNANVTAPTKDWITLQSACQILTIFYFPENWMLKISRNLEASIPLLERLDKLTPSTFEAIGLASWEETYFPTSRSTAGRLWFRAAHRRAHISPLPSRKLTPTFGIAFSEEMLKNLCLHHFQQGWGKHSDSPLDPFISHVDDFHQKGGGKGMIRHKFSRWWESKYISKLKDIDNILASPCRRECEPYQPPPIP